MQNIWENTKPYVTKFKNTFLQKDIHETINALEEYQNKKDEIESIYRMAEKCKKQEKEEEKEENCIIGDDLYGDLEVFSDYRQDNNNTLLSMFSSSKEYENSQHVLRGSRLFLQQLLSFPLRNVQKLQERQNIIRSILDLAKKKEYYFSWKVVQKNESKVAWFFHAPEDISQQLFDMVYLNNWLFKHLNNSHVTLTGYNLYRIIFSPLVGIFTPLCYVIIPYLVLRLKCKIDVDFLTYLKFSLKMFLSSSQILPGNFEKFRKLSIGLTIVFYFQGLFNTIELSKASYKITRILTTKINSLLNYLYHGHLLTQNLWDPIFSSKHEDTEKNTEKDADVYIDKLLQNYFYKNVNSNTDAQDIKENHVIGGIDGEDFSLFSSFGKQLNTYKFLDTTKCIPLIRKLYVLDMYYSIGKLTQTHFTSMEKSFGNERRFSWATYIKDPETVLEIQGVYHPCLPCIPFSHITKNDIILGKNKDDHNMLLTGPNAGGKSTLIKSIMLNVLLAQTLTVTNSYYTRLYPFTFLNTQINIPDCKGKQSLFEAEMFRSKKNFDILDNLNKDDKALIVMDEIFSSTNPIEGMAGAYAIAKKLGQYSNTINIISTHYAFLTKLQKEAHLFTNYCMNVFIDEEKDIIRYPYVLNKGISRQYIALELLRKNGFCIDIIDEAVRIKNSFFTTKKQ